MSINLADISEYEQLQQAFLANNSWDTQYRLIIKLGKLLPAIEPSLKTQVHQVNGCESLAWLVIDEQQGKYYLQMDSDTRVVKGLMKIIYFLFDGKTTQQIAQIDCHAVFAELGLLSHLSPSRANGLFAIINSIYEVAGLPELHHDQ